MGGALLQLGWARLCHTWGGHRLRVEGAEAHHEERTGGEGAGQCGGAARCRMGVGIGCKWRALRRVMRSAQAVKEQV